ncbi:N-acetylmuramoyl-L-alanine amidase [Gordonia sp. GONU]
MAWHAGAGSHPGWPTDNANWHVIGIEAVNDGGGQAWTGTRITRLARP